MAWRDTRASRRRLLLFSTSIVMGIAALVAIRSFAASAERAIDQQSRLLLGADLSVTSRRALSAADEKLLASLGGDKGWFADRRFVQRTAQVDLEDLGVTVVFPFGRCPRWSHADVARTEQSLFATGAFDLSHHLGGMGDVVDDERMFQRGFGNVERRFLEDGCVKRTPAHILTVGEHIVFRAHRAPECLADGKGNPLERHLDLLRSWLGSYTLPPD